MTLGQTLLGALVSSRELVGKMARFLVALVRLFSAWDLAVVCEGDLNCTQKAGLDNT